MLNPANDNGDPITFFSVCSGIEAATVAWSPLGWQCVGVSEIEKFPSAVLAHHYPDVKNHGDFTTVDVATLPRVDILCGGTPCQAFSVAGLRRSLDDARGNLSLSFVRLAHELADNNGLRNVVWENVPGVLSTKDNAFGCFLGALVGADDAVPPPAGRRWPDEGMVSGPKGRAAWAVLDAQYFGLAQRRKRVILVADFGNGADPAAVLLEFHGLSRNPPTRGEAGKDIAPTISARTKGGGGLGTDFDLDGGLVESARIAPTVSTGTRGVGDFELGGGLAYAPEIARCDATREGSSQDYETTTRVAVDVAPTMRAGGNSTGGDRPYGTDVDTCDSLAVVSIHADAIGRTGDALTPGPDAAGVVRLRNPGMGIVDDGTTYNLMASGQPHAVAYAVQAGALRTNPKSGLDGVGVQEGISYTLEARSEVQAVVYSIMPQNSGKDYKARIVDVAQPIMAAGPSNGNQGGDVVCVTGTVTHTLKAEGADASEDGTGRGTPIVAFDTTQITSKANRSNPQPGDPCHPLSAGAHPPAIVGSAVRRLTPRECERLQGFQWLCSPDYPGAWQDDAGRWWSPDYTIIPYGNKLKGEAKDELAAYFERTGQFMMEVADGEWVFDHEAFEAAWPRLAADGPRYKALGNSWAVPKFTWLGRRIAMHMPKRTAAQKEAA